MSTVRRLLASTLIVSVTALGMPLPAQAGMLSTEQAVGSSARARISTLLDRQEVQAKLAAYGVDAADAKARIAALSDDEAAQLAGRIDQLPAGGDAAGALLGAAVLVFIVLLITDILGYTHVFPFTKSMRR